MENIIPNHLANHHQHQQQLMLSPEELEHILRESKHRWLRPTEILQILSNYSRFKLSAEAPNLPPAGSLFLFDRKALRYFRRDGHSWRKKKDRKTVREAHEKLKVCCSFCYLLAVLMSSIVTTHMVRTTISFSGDVIGCLMSISFDHIVLVHYREVKERHKFSTSHVPVDQAENLEPSSAAPFSQSASPASAIGKTYTSPQNRAVWNRRSLADDASLLASNNKGFYFPPDNPPSLSAGAKFYQGTEPSLWLETYLPIDHETSIQGQRVCFVKPNMADYAIHTALVGQSNSETTVPYTTGAPQSDDETHNHSKAQLAVVSTSQAGKWKDDGDFNKFPSLKKLDSFGRWMNKEMGQDCDDSLILSGSGDYWNSVGAEDEREVSSLSHHMQLDVDSCGPSLSQVQLFSIHDFAPEWAYTGVETKVLIVGTFLEKLKPDSETRWGCMFGDIEVSAEVLNGNSIRCKAPVHGVGSVPFYVTCRNRLACSEVREFHYRENPKEVSSPSVRSVQDLEFHFQVRLAKLISLNTERKLLNCSVVGCKACKLTSSLNSFKNHSIEDYGKGITEWMISEGHGIDHRDGLIQCLIRDKLREWLLYVVHEGGKGPNILDEEGQGVIHLASGLGYNWAVGLVVETSGNPNFRDARGRTGLHWASYFGREETVVALVKLGVDPTAVDDPTPAFPGGQTAADVASGQGHKGIAGYLAEAFLSRQLSSMSISWDMADRSKDSTSADKNARIVATQLSLPSNMRVEDDQISLKESLAAVRKSAHAAALIQAVYRGKPLLGRQLHKGSDDHCDFLLRNWAALGTLKKPQKENNHFEDCLHSAAVKIQKKYRGWKGRKDFLIKREKVVRIQAHVRGHQVRRHYKKIVWSVSIVEKAILRWRRKGAGLRGFNVKKEIQQCGMLSNETNEYEYLINSRQLKSLGVEKALARVTSMVRYPEARDQYLRLVTKFGTLKVGDTATLDWAAIE
ncbi:Calmodulin-binding transcription activator 3 [Linum perenne]